VNTILVAEQLAPLDATALPSAVRLISAPKQRFVTGAGQVSTGGTLHTAVQLTVTVNEHVAELPQPSTAV
jgi:hypothetical protein